MQIIPGQLCELAVGNKFRLHVSGRRVECGLVELGHTIKEPRCTNEFIEELAIDINARSVVRACEEIGEVRQVPSLAWVVESQCRRQRRTIYFDAFGM